MATSERNAEKIPKGEIPELLLSYGFTFPIKETNQSWGYVGANIGTNGLTMLSAPLYGVYASYIVDSERFYGPGVEIFLWSCTAAEQFGDTYISYGAPTRIAPNFRRSQRGGLSLYCLVSFDYISTAVTRKRWVAS